MNLDEFTQITLTVASESGIASYAPTIIAREQVRVIQGIPEGYDHRQAIQEVIQQQGLGDEEFFFGVRSGAQEITTGHHRHGVIQFARILGLAQGFTIVPMESCEWWAPGGSAQATEH
jgi:hypothetical protein